MSEKEKELFEVKGTLKNHFGNVIGYFETETMAVSEKKAVSNALAQAKRDRKLSYKAKLTFGSDLKVTKR